MDTCNLQYQARLAVCEELGGTRYHPTIDPADFVKGVDNNYYPLPPGRTLGCQGTGPEGAFSVETVITADTKTILGVTCVVVRDTVTMGGLVVEDTLDWYAQDTAGNVWYFGEESKGFVDGDLVTLEGSWLAGRDGAQPGIVMEANPQPGDQYRQEYNPDVAEDVSKILTLGNTVTVIAGTYDNCVKTKDFSPLEPDVVEHKFFAPGVGSILELQVKGGTERMELVEIK